MRGLGRNMKFWIRTLEGFTLGALLGMAVASVFVAASSEGDLWLEILTTLPAYLVMATPLLCFTNAYSSLNTYFPLTVSLGSDRKSSFVAMQIAQHFIVLQLLIIGLLLALPAWFEGDEWFWLIKAALTASFLLMGSGMLSCTIFLKFGRSVGVVVYLISLVIIVLAFVWVVLSLIDDSITITVSFSGAAALLNKPWMLLVAIGFDAAMIGVLYRNVCKTDLQFA